MNEYPDGITSIRIPYYVPILVLLLLFGLIGFVNTPFDSQGQPMLLLPDVKAMMQYQKIAQKWNQQFTQLDGELSQLLSNQSSGDLFTQSRNVQSIAERTISIGQEIDRTQTPATATGLHESLSQVAGAYLETARTALRWVSNPEESVRKLAITNLTVAHDLLEKLEAKTWISRP
jgi:hydroxypyruvate isomerase